MASTYDPRTAQTTGPTVDTSAALRGGSDAHRRVSWSAVFAGVILAIAVQLLLSLLGAGIGLGTVNVNSGATPSAGSLGIGAGIWWVVSSCIALFIGGYVTAWLGGIEIRVDGLLHGLVTWGITTLLTVWLLSSAIGGIIGGGFSAIGSVTKAAGSGVTQAAKVAGVSPDMIQQQAQAYLQSTDTDPATMSPQDAQKAIGTNLVTYMRGGGDASAARDRIINIIAAQRKISHDEAVKQFDDSQAKLSETKDQTVQTAKNAADAGAGGASKAAFAAFAVLLLDLIAAAIGGSVAVQRRLLVAPRTADGRNVGV